MLSDTALIAALAGLAGAVIGSGGLYAWFKVGPERRKITTEIHTSVLRDSHTAYQNISDELSQIRMNNIMLEEENEHFRGRVSELERVIVGQQEAVNRHGRMAELARRKAHVALNGLGGYELHIEHLLDRLRDENINLTPLDRPTRLRQALQAEMNKLEELESVATAQAITDSASASDTRDRAS
jgi:hypothetical protein